MDRNKILIIQTAFLGDAILTLPMIQELSKKNPSAKIDVISIPSTAEIFKSSPYINDVIVLDKRGRQKSLFNLLRFVLFIRKQNYIKIYSPHRSMRSSLIVFFSNVKETFGFENSALSFVYKNVIPYETGLHEVARNLRLIGLENEKDDWKIKPEISIRKDGVKKIDSVLIKTAGKKIIAVAPGSVWQTKKYPFEYYIKVIEYILYKNFFVVLIGGTEDKELCDSLACNNENINSLAGKLSIVESIELLKRCSLIICNDSAPTHMGMIADIPILTIYCSTVPGFGFYPYNERSDFISFDDLNCKPCGIHGHKKCPVKTFDCGYKLSVKTVCEHIEKLLT